MDVDQHLARIGNAHQRIGLRGDFTDSRADGQQQVRLFDPRDEGGARPGAEIADERGRPVVDDVLPSERTADRELVGLGKSRDVLAGSVVPATAADQHDRPFRRSEEPVQFCEIDGAGMGVHGPVGADHRRRTMIAQHVLG